MTTAATMVLRSATRFWDASSTKLQLDPGHIFLFNTVALASCVLAAYVFAVFTSSHGDQSIPQKRGIPIIGSWAFFTRRYTFLEEGLERLGRAFRFNILRHKVLVVSGEEARKVFYGHKDLSMSEGYKILFGGVPDLKTIGMEGERGTGDIAWFGKRILNILKRERLAVMIPLLIGDCDRAMRGWGDSGTFNSFDNIYNIVFQLSIRAGSCREIADSPAAVKRVTELYWLTERGSTATTVLLPWLPSRARRLKNDATRELYEIVKTHVEERRDTGKREVDAMQVLLDEGDGVRDIVQFILGVLFAGIINTGIMSSWMVLYLHMHPEWKAKATAEVHEFMHKYTESSQDGHSDLVSRLSHIPPEIWDEEMPVLDACLRETIRMVFSGAAIRRVMSDGIVIDGVHLEKGSFVAYQAKRAHFNEDVWEEPEKWDPGRFDRGDGTKEQWSFLGWGVGRHPCLGMRFAKLEVKIILALFLTRYDYTLVDGEGKPVKTLPEPYRDNLYQVPPSKPVYVNYKRVAA